MFMNFILLMMGLNVSYYSELVKKRNHEWQMKPGVTVCSHTGVQSFRVSQAIKYWEKLGYRFDYIRYDDTISCGEPRFGEIILTIPDQEFNFSDHMASTRITISNETREIVKAKIFLFPKTANKERVLEHELGHALGWPHINIPYHIMNANWHTGGHNSKGLHLKQFYKNYVD